MLRSSPPGRRRTTWAAGAAATLALLGACGAATDGAARTGSAHPSATATPKRVQVVTTVAPITSIAAAVAGDRAEIRGLVPEGTNSHTFEPPPSAAKVLSDADLVIVNGLKLEDPTKDLATSNMSKDARLIEIGTAVLPESDYIYDFSFPKEAGKPNPHLWTDPTYAIKYAEEIRKGLTDVDPTGADTYRANYETFAGQATALSDALKADQATITGPRVLLTYHDAYAYFARTYGWNVVGAIQPESFDDPTPKEVARLIDQVKAEKVPVIFGSEVFPSKALEEIGRATGARYEDTLRDDDLPGRPGDADHSWLGLMRYDYVKMIKGLGGTTERLDALDMTPSMPDTAEYPQ
jgi:ABC-type Zn uptake system ZnuABC Zn-binding protein ZnuA